MATFRHLPIGSAIGSGSFVFRHFGSEAAYVPYNPPDTETFPTLLTGFYAEPLSGLATGASSSYIGSVFAKPWLSQNAKKLGRIYSSIGNGVSSFSTYSMGNLAIGYSADSASAGNKALNIWCFDYKPTAAEANAWIDEQNSVILYELFESDGSAWAAVERVADGALGYYNAAADVFVPVKDMDAQPLLRFSSPGPDPDPEPDPDDTGI